MVDITRALLSWHRWNHCVYGFGVVRRIFVQDCLGVGCPLITAQ